MIVLETVFWFSAALVTYTYIGYALLLLLVPKQAPASETDETPGSHPVVTLIIAAYNEESFIGRKIENSLAVQHDDFDFRVVVVSDGSEDKTNEIAESYSDPRLTFLPLAERGGKANALNQALDIVAGDYVVFTDANVFLEPSAIARLLDWFADSTVGAVTGKVELEAFDSTEPLGEGAYMRYERLVQRLESDFWSAAGVDGALFAARRELVSGIPSDTILDDFLIGTRVALAGRRVVYQSEATATEQVPAEVSQEFRRKTRISAGCFQFLDRLNWRVFFAAPKSFQFAFVSHKLVRWYVPFLLLLCLSTNLFLLEDAVYKTTLLAQILVYGMAVIAYLLPSLRSRAIPYVAYYFCAMNAALLVGWFRNRSSGQSVTWKRVDR